MVYVISAEYAEEFKVDVVFNDGTKTWIDLRATMENDSRLIVRSLLDMTLFSRVSIEMDTLVWPNGFDLAPEYLYDLARVRRTA